MAQILRCAVPASNNYLIAKYLQLIINGYVIPSKFVYKFRDIYRQINVDVCIGYVIFIYFFFQNRSPTFDFISHCDPGRGQTQWCTIPFITLKNLYYPIHNSEKFVLSQL